MCCKCRKVLSCCQQHLSRSRLSHGNDGLGKEHHTAGSLPGIQVLSIVVVDWGPPGKCTATVITRREVGLGDGDEVFADMPAPPDPRPVRQLDKDDAKAKDDLHDGPGEAERGGELADWTSESEYLLILIATAGEQGAARPYER